MKLLPNERTTRADYPSEIIEGCRAGDAAALERVFRAEAPYLERVLARLVGPRADLEDLLQSTLENAIRGFPNFRGEASVRTWLTRIAVRSALAHLKHPAQKRRAALEVIEGGAGSLEAGASRPELRPDVHIETRRRLSVLYEHLDKVEVKQRTAFLLFSIEGRSMDEIAALMGAGLNATKSRVMWARRKLLARLRKDPRAKDWLSDYTGGET